MSRGVKVGGLHEWDGRQRERDERSSDKSKVTSKNQQKLPRLQALTLTLTLTLTLNTNLYRTR